MKTQCDCGHVAISNGVSTGYGTTNEGKKICFACCGEADKEYLRRNGKMSGYFSGNEFSNWPGSFKIRVNHIRKSWHNMAGRDGRTDFWLTFEGRRYHGVHIGHNNTCATIKLTK